MIVGEFEALVTGNDSFLGGGDAFFRRTTSQEDRQQRQQQRQEATAWIKDTVNANGGIEGITQTVGNLASLFKKSEDYGPSMPAAYDTPSDYAVAVGGPPSQEASMLTKYAPMVLGGMAVVGVAVFILLRKKAQGSVKPTVAPAP